MAAQLVLVGVAEVLDPEEVMEGPGVVAREVVHAGEVALEAEVGAAGREISWEVVQSTGRRLLKIPQPDTGGSVELTEA